MSVVTLKQMRETGPNGCRHHLEENKDNFRTVYHALDGFTCDMGIVTRKASEALANAQGECNARTILNALYDLERRTKQALSLLESYMGEVTFIEEAMPVKDLIEQCV